MNKSTHQVFSFLFVFTFLCSFSSLIIGQTPTPTPCPNCPTDGTPPIPGTQKGWKRGATVDVWIDPAVTGQMRQGIEDSFTAWNAANQTNGSGVTFRIVNTQPTVGAENTYVFKKGKVYDDDGVTRLRGITIYDTDTATGNTYSAVTTIDETVVWKPAARETAVHEIGHPMGLDDCEDSGCTPGCSVMTLVVNTADDLTASARFNTTYDRATSPTGCDNNTLRDVNYPPQDDGNGGGGGECPCGDCDNGCPYPPPDEGEPNCSWQTVDGQCYGGYEWTDPYTGILYSEPPSCDPPTEQYVCQ